MNDMMKNNDIIPNVDYSKRLWRNIKSVGQGSLKHVDQLINVENDVGNHNQGGLEIPSAIKLSHVERW